MCHCLLLSLCRQGLIRMRVAPLATEGADMAQQKAGKNLKLQGFEKAEYFGR